MLDALRYHVMSYSKRPDISSMNSPTRLALRFRLTVASRPVHDKYKHEDEDQ